MSLDRGLLQASFIAVSIFFAASVCAQAPDTVPKEPSAADLGAARALGQEGVKLADAGNCADAVERLQRAERIFHAPTTLARLGECQVQLGKLVEGTENLNRAVREVLPLTAPQAFREAQERAKKVIAEAKPKIAKLKIAVAAPPEAKVVVTIDGEPVPLATLNTNRPTDPGAHVVEASAPDFLKATQTITLSEGGVDSVALTLEPDPNAPKPEKVAAPKATEPAPVAPSPAPPVGGAPSRVPAYAALGAGVVGVGVGAVFGLLALGKKGDLDAACVGKVCPSAQQDNLDGLKTQSTVSTVGFVVGGVGLAVGGFLFATSGPSSASARASASVRRRGPSVEASVGPGSVGLSGRF
jgi:hypothetical protein